MDVDEPLYRDHVEAMRLLGDLARTAHRCRVVNRAFGSSFTPDQIAGMLPDEAIDLLLYLDDADQIGDQIAYLRTLVRKG